MQGLICHARVAALHYPLINSSRPNALYTEKLYVVQFTQHANARPNGSRIEDTGMQLAHTRAYGITPSINSSGPLKSIGR